MNVNTNMNTVSPLLTFYQNIFLNVIIMNFGLSGFACMPTIILAIYGDGKKIVTS